MTQGMSEDDTGDDRMTMDVIGDDTGDDGMSEDDTGMTGGDTGDDSAGLPTCGVRNPGQLCWVHALHVINL